MPEYKVTVVAAEGAAEASGSWKRYESEVPLEYGNEITIESDERGGRTLRARVTAVDNDALFTSKVTVEPIDEG
jgi:hypothetical protein